MTFSNTISRAVGVSTSTSNGSTLNFTLKLRGRCRHGHPIRTPPCRRQPSCLQIGGSGTSPGTGTCARSGSKSCRPTSQRRRRRSRKRRIGGRSPPWGSTFTRRSGAWPYFWPSPDSTQSRCAQIATRPPSSTPQVVTSTMSRPCPRWPMHAARMEHVSEILRAASTRVHNTQPAPPKPQPLAALPADLPITEVIARLQELQAQHPDAVVKRGRANRWELWPPDTVRT